MHMTTVVSRGLDQHVTGLIELPHELGQTYMTAHTNPICVDLTTRGTLDFERVIVGCFRRIRRSEIGHAGLGLVMTRMLVRLVLKSLPFQFCCQCQC